MISGKIVEILKKLGIIIGAILVIFLIMGFYINTELGMPPNAILFLNDQNKTYLSPPCVQDQQGLHLSTHEENDKLNYRPDPTCRDQHGFTQDGRNLIGIFLEKIGLLEPIQNRWNIDGTWNW